MAKLKIGPKPFVYPMPNFLVGAMVNGKPNIMTVAWGGMVCLEPPAACVSIGHARYTNSGIKQNKTFSINVPSTDLVKETDYCGIASGEHTNKIKDCKFKIFYGKLKSAPMIEQCPVNLECSMIHMLDLGSHELIIGKIEEIYADEECLTEGRPDAFKIKPFTMCAGYQFTYNKLGDVIAKAFNVGKELKYNF